MNAAVVVIGAGGHAKVCIELLRAAGHEVDSCVGGTGDPAFCLDVPVHAGDHHLGRLRDAGLRRAFVAIGANAARDRIGSQLQAQGWELVNAVSPAAVLSPTARLGRGVAVMAGAVVNACTVIEDLAILNTCASIDHDGLLGRAAHVAPHGGLAGNVRVGARAFLGVGCKVIPGCDIGDDAFAAAGAVIVGRVAPATRVRGVPARPFD